MTTYLGEKAVGIGGIKATVAVVGDVLHDDTLVGNGNTEPLGVNTANIVSQQTLANAVSILNTAIDGQAEAIAKTRNDFEVADQKIRADMNEKDSELESMITEHAEELTTLRGNQASLGDQVSGIEEKIPGSASSSNPLATKQDLANVKVDLTGYATETYVNTREQKIRDDVNQADSELQSQITAQASAITANTTSINGVKAVIPQGTSETNPLITKQQLLDEEMDIRDDVNEMVSELQTQITAQAGVIASIQDEIGNVSLMLDSINGEIV